MGIKKLRSGVFSPIDVSGQTTDAPGKLTKKVRLVYRGSFESMDGPVQITDEIIHRIAAHHNARMSKFGETPPMGECPPLQVDHSVSGWDTIGRLTGLMTVDEEEISGEVRLALYGFATVLGPDNCERVRDGRWTNVSIGADLDTGELKELTVVPFSAAPHAAFLAAGDQMEKEKLKKHLKSKGMSDKDADDKLSKMSEDDCKKELSHLAEKEEEEKAKLAKEEEEKAKLAKEEEEKAKLSAQTATMAGKKERLTQLMAKGKGSMEGVQLAAAKSDVISRLSKLRGDRKLTPAEQKKIDVTKLAKMSKEARDAVLSSYEQREPVIMAGQFGTVKGIEASQLLSKEVKMAAIEKESRANFKSLGAKRMESGPGAEMPPKPTASLEAEPTDAGLSAEHVTQHLGLIHKHLKDGNHEAAMTHLKHLMKLWGDHAEKELPAATEKSNAEMTAMNGQIAELAAMFAETQELVAALVA